MRRNKQIDIKRALALSSIFNFLCCCARGCLLPFLTLYLRQLGLNPAMAGIVMGTKHLIALVWSPAAGLLSKHYNKRRVVINASLVCSAAVALLLLLIPQTDVHTRASTCNASNLSSAPVQSFNDKLLTSSVGQETSLTRTPTKGFVSQPGVTIPAKTITEAKSAHAITPTSHHHPHHHGDESNSLLSQVASVGVNDSPGIGSSSAAPVRNKRSNSKSGSEGLQGEKVSEDGSSFGFLGNLKVMDPQHQLFFLTLIVVSVWEMASAPLEWTADDGLYEYLDFADAADRYSSTGPWGVLGVACGAGGAGLLVSQLSCVISGHTSRSAAHFYCYVALAALALPVAAYLPLHRNKKRERAGGLLKAVQLVRGSPRALLCALTVLLVGAASSAVDNFLLWQMQDHGSNELHMGSSLSLALLSQVAFSLVAGRVSKLLSPGRVLVVGAASLSLQCLYYSFLWGPWAALVAQVLSCFSSGGLWWAVNAQCEDVATPEAERSVRRVYGALALHLGAGAGSFAGGFVAQRFGLAWLFRGVAVALVLWCACLLVLQWKAPRQRRINYSRLLAANASEASDSESEQERDWLDKAMEDERSNNNYGRRINH